MNTGSNTDLMTTAGVGALAIVASVSKAQQWRDPASGRVSFPLMISGMATALVLAAVVRAAGAHYGVEPWVQCAGSGVLCYVGPDPIIRAIAGMALKRFGVQENGNQGNATKP